MLSLLSLLWAADAEGVLRHHLDQAREFYKHKYYEDAASEVSEALQSDLGRQAYEVWWLAAQIDYARLDVDAAVAHVTGAISVAKSAEDRERSLSFRDFLVTSFGFLELEGPHEGSSSRIELVSQSLILDPDLKAMMAEQARRLETPHHLPLRVALPVGRYAVGSQTVDLTAGATTRLVLAESELRALGTPRLTAGLGVELAIGELLGSRSLAPGVALGLEVPVGPLLLGAAAAWEAVSYDDALGGSHRDVRAGSVGLLLGTDRLRTGALWFLPAISFRYAWIPGLRLHCVDHLCSAEGPPGTPEVALLGTALAPGIRLATEFRPSNRGLGVGFRWRGDALIGSLPAAGSALASEGAYSWTVQDPHWAGLATEFSLYLSMPL